MKCNFKGLAVIAWFALVCVCTLNAQDAGSKAVQELFLKSGLDQLTHQLPILFQQEIDQAYEQDPNLRKLPQHFFKEVKEAAATAYAPPKTRGIMIKSISSKMSASDIKSVLKWLDSPLGKKCTEFEKESVTSKGLNDMAQFAQQLQKNPPPPKRLKLIGELDQATNATASTVEAYMNTHLAVASAVALSLPQETRRPLSQIKKELERNRIVIEKALQQQTLVSMLYTYHTLSDADIQEYIDFAVSPSGIKYHKVTIEAFQLAMIECSADFGQAVGKAVENINKKSSI